MVRLRLKRMGRRHRPFYRLNAMDKREPRDGRVLEELGWFDPMATDDTKQVSFKVDRIRHWISQGAQPSDTVMDLLSKHQVIDGEAWKVKRAGKVNKRMGEIVEKKNAEAAAAAAEAKAKVEAEAAEAKAKAEAEAKAAAEAIEAEAAKTEDAGE